jgi:hypothetical protein
VAATDFLYQSASGMVAPANDPTGGYYSAIKVREIDGPEGSGTIGFVPIPGSALLLAPGLILLVAIGRKFRSKP